LSNSTVFKFSEIKFALYRQMLHRVKKDKTIFNVNLTRDFRPQVFSSNNFPWALFEYGFEFAKIFEYEIADLGNIGVNDLAVPKTILS
jgi:hypothetical protein